MSAKELLDQELRKLVGLPLLSLGRTANMVWFHFGLPRTIPYHKGATREVGEYALHVQCTWRLRGSGHIITGSGDMAYSAHGTCVAGEEGEANLLDKRIHKFLEEYPSCSLRVAAVAADELGSISIAIGEHLTLELFPDNSSSPEYSEYWRLFHPGTQDAHLVVTTVGFRYDD